MSFVIFAFFIDHKNHYLLDYCLAYPMRFLQLFEIVEDIFTLYIR
jgi:hypothetical protein